MIFIIKLKKQITPRRLRIIANAVAKLTTSGVEVKGREHLAEIKSGKPVIIVTSHISELDIPLVAYALAKDFNIAITVQSIHHTLKGDIRTYLALLVAGRKNFLPITWNKQDGVRVGVFNPKDFLNMLSSVKQGKTLLIAAHNPTKDRKLPQKGGKGAAYLSQLIKGAIILPVAVELDSDFTTKLNGQLINTVSKKPKAIVKIGKPFELKDMGVAEKIIKIKEKFENETKNYLILKDLSDIIMKHIAKTLNEK